MQLAQQSKSALVFVGRASCMRPLCPVFAGHVGLMTIAPSVQEIETGRATLRLKAGSTQQPRRRVVAWRAETPVSVSDTVWALHVYHDAVSVAKHAHRPSTTAKRVWRVVHPLFAPNGGDVLMERGIFFEAGVSTDRVVCSAFKECESLSPAEFLEHMTPFDSCTNAELYALVMTHCRPACVVLHVNTTTTQRDMLVAYEACTHMLVLAGKSVLSSTDEELTVMLTT